MWYSINKLVFYNKLINFKETEIWIFRKFEIVKIIEWNS